MISLIFPGQGAQKVGMLSAFFLNAYPAATDIVRRIEDATEIKISEIIENGSPDELRRTDNAQLAIFTTSMVCLEILKSEYNFNISKQCKFLAGHSLGEISALCASNVFSLEDAAKIVKIRGKAMASLPSDNFLMAAILGLSLNDISPIIAEFENLNEFCSIANDNMSTQVVISGYKSAVTKAIEKIQKKFTNSKAIFLNTSGPFHTSLMSQAAINLEKYLLSDEVEYNDFEAPVISNFSAMVLNNKNEVCNELVKQVISPVRWRETINLIVNDFDVNAIVEVAPGKVLTSMIKRDYPDIKTISLDTIAQIEEFAKLI